MASRDLQTQTTILVPAVDFYQRGFQRQTIGAFDTLGKVSKDYFTKFEERVATLEKRKEDLQARGQKVFETIQGLVGAKTAIRVETPNHFPIELDFDTKKVAMSSLKADHTIPKNERLLSQLESNQANTFSMRDSKIKGDPSKVEANELGEAIKSVCQSYKVPIIYPINSQPQNSHIEKLYLPRTQLTRRKMKYIDGSLIFNTKNSIFYHFVPEKLAEKRQKKKTGPEANPILESGNLTQFAMGVDKADDQMESGYVPKTTAQITLLDAPTDTFLTDSMSLSTDFLGADTGFGFSSENNFFLDSIMSTPQTLQKPTAPQAVTAQASTAQDSVEHNATPGSIPAPPSGGIPAPPPIAGLGNIPPPPSGVIPPPPPLSSILSKKKEEDEGGNVADEKAALKPIADDKSSIFT